MTPVEFEPAGWDLSDLYSGVRDPGLTEDCRRSEERAQSFHECYAGRIAVEAPEAGFLSRALAEYEDLLQNLAKPGAYAGLLFAADTRDPARGALLQRTRESATAAHRHLIFFDLELGRLSDAAWESVREDPRLANYRYFVERQRELARYRLSEAEEQLADEMANTGRRALTRLFSEVTSRASFRLEFGGEVRELNQSRLTSLFYDPDRGLRSAAAAAYTTTLREKAHVCGFLYNHLLSDAATQDRLRGLSFPEQSRHLDNDLDPEIVETMVRVVLGSVGNVHRYYRLKRRLLSLDELTHVDRYGPIRQTGERIPYTEARRIVLEGLRGFSPDLAAMVEPFFTRGWIDSEVRDGKRGGAFCSSVTPDLHPYVFMNYTGTTRDVMTLAHELGHAVHGLLARQQSYLNFYSTLPLAETASVFAEMLVFEELKRRQPDPRARLALNCSKIEDTFATVYRQASMYRFEQAAHRARREEGELTVERLSELFQANLQPMFGDALALGEEHALWWLFVPHFYHTPFYVYAYSFGELVVLALYARYLQEGSSFVQSYLSLLGAGGSRRPEALLRDLGIDPRDRAFWQGGVDLIGDLVDDALELAG